MQVEEQLNPIKVYNMAWKKSITLPYSAKDGKDKLANSKFDLGSTCNYGHNMVRSPLESLKWCVLFFWDNSLNLF